MVSYLTKISVHFIINKLRGASTKISKLYKDVTLIISSKNILLNWAILILITKWYIYGSQVGGNRCIKIKNRDLHNQVKERLRY